MKNNAMLAAAPASQVEARTEMDDSLEYMKRLELTLGVKIDSNHTHYPAVVLGPTSHRLLRSEGSVAAVTRMKVPTSSVHWVLE